jgi:cell division protein FtsL
MAYTRGNLAVKEKVQQKAPRRRYRETTKVVTRRKELPTREKLLYLTTVVAFIAVLIMLAGRYAQIYQLSASIHTKEVAISQLQTSIAELRVQKERLENQIVTTAKEQGYIEPTKEPIRVYTGTTSSNAAAGGSGN